MPKDQGFTLFEVLVTVIIIGILAALGIPSLLGTINANRIRQAQSQVQGILQGAQRQALTQGVQCDPQLNLDTNPITISEVTNNGCLTATTLVLPQDVKIQTNLETPIFYYSFKGRYFPDSPIETDTAIVFSSDRANTQRCLVLGNLMGIMRSGEYTPDPDDPDATPDPDRCDTTTDSI
jgi:prepilin-type N-terminal cleavage/methylation domain-containing protein